ncbi:MAG: hypothetical protein K2P70_01970 [Hyphomonadaceae bacterium]|nr:hypothetical protein [Hyphomonadaceae bacterium]
MKDFETSTTANDGAVAAADLESGPYAAILPLVRLLARQAARDDYARALEAARAKSYPTLEPPDAHETIEES